MTPKGGRTISDSILLEILYEGRSGSPGANLDNWCKTNGQQVAMLDLGGLIDRTKAGLWVLTALGEKRLRERYPSKFKKEKA